MNWLAVYLKMHYSQHDVVFAVITVTRETTALIRPRILFSPPAVAVVHVEWNGKDTESPLPFSYFPLLLFTA